MTTDNMTTGSELIERVADIVIAYVANNQIPAHDLPALITSIHSTLSGLGQPGPEPKPVPAVNPKKSVFDDRIISLEDGKSYKSMKRHLSTRGMTPEGYRAKWELP